MGRDRDDQVEIAAAARTAAAFASDPDSLACPHAGRNPHVHVAACPLPTGAVARRTRLAADIAAAMAGGAWLVDLQRERLARPVESLVERDLDRGLDVLTATTARPAAEAPAEQIFEPRLTTARAPASSEIAEDRAEELGKVAAVTVLDGESAGPRASAGRARLSVPLPVGTEGVVAAALVRVGQDLIRLVDLLEARVLPFVDVGMVLTRELSIRRLDGLVVGGSLDAQNPVVVLELNGHALNPTWSVAGDLSVRHSKTL